MPQMKQIFYANVLVSIVFHGFQQATFLVETEKKKPKTFYNGTALKVLLLAYLN